MITIICCNKECRNLLNEYLYTILPFRDISYSDNVSLKDDTIIEVNTPILNCIFSFYAENKTIMDTEEVKKLYEENKDFIDSTHNNCWEQVSPKAISTPKRKVNTRISTMDHTNKITELTNQLSSLTNDKNSWLIERDNLKGEIDLIRIELQGKESTFSEYEKTYKYCCEQKLEIELLQNTVNLIKDEYRCILQQKEQEIEQLKLNNGKFSQSVKEITSNYENTAEKISFLEDDIANKNNEILDKTNTIQKQEEIIQKFIEDRRISTDRMKAYIQEIESLKTRLSHERNALLIVKGELFKNPESKNHLYFNGA